MASLKHRSNYETVKSVRCSGLIINAVIFFFCFIWCVAVVKVVLLEGDRSNQNEVTPKFVESKTEGFITKTINYDRHEQSLPELGRKDSAKEMIPKSSDWNYVEDRKSVVKLHDPEKIAVYMHPAPKLVVSKEGSSGGENPKSESKQEDSLNPSNEKNKKSKPKVIKPAYDLSWPPVRVDGSIPEDEGYDVMTLTELKVPRFWEPKPNEDLTKSGTKVNGHETIFLMIASYRDFQCHDTINSAFRNMDHPERLFVGAVEQAVPGDIGCAYTEKPCEEDPEQPICKYRDQISVYKMDAKMATGPVTARHIGDRLYRGQYFVMQMDAHCQFIRHWDTLLIRQWLETKNEMAVLSSYLTDVQGSIDANGDSTRDTRPIMCNSDFEGAMPSRYLRHGSQPEDLAEVRESPQLQPFWAAGFSFSRGHFKVRVPYDAYQPMVFQGEEISIGIRGFTYGYDFYAPRDSVVFHEYAEKSNRRKKVPMFWENSQKHMGEGRRSLARSMSIIKMAPDIEAAAWDHREESRYGIGTVRPLELFYKLFLINTKQRKAVQLCPFVKSGIMHRQFSKFLKPDGLGIDYSKLENFDTAGTLKSRLKAVGRPTEEIDKLLQGNSGAPEEAND